MTDLAIGFAGIGVAVFLILARIPIAVALTTVSFVGIMLLVGERAAFGILTAVIYDFVAKWTLTSIPMFLLMGFLCFHAGLTRGLFNMCRVWLSRLPGGLAITAVVGSAGFATVSGSSVACAAAMGRIAVPEMLRYGYKPELATGSIAAAGTIGALIPPSILLILFGTFTQTPISLLFLGGIGAGLLTAISYILLIIIRVKLDPSLAPPVTEVISREERRAAAKETWPTLLLILIVFGGLFSGVFTATEAGAVGAAASFLVAALNRTLSLRVIWLAVRETTFTTATIFVITIGANLLTRFLSLSDVAGELSQFVISFGAEPWILALGLVVLYLMLGLILEPLGALLLTLPVVLPVMQASDASLIWYGVLIVKLLEVGMITPPVGLNVFVVKSVVGDRISTSAIFRGIWWFLIVDVIVLGLMIAFPQLITFIPDLIGT
ncbi:TRAP transporter large permease [Pseudohoeflea coraliihabitans]|uniref:TRAP transporter large permease protein n=1 Tax=Pseudohoeflea coraliihabitans TaxID=2860393 RepID=A0ABS6WV72_9HYPH|nr:TRAP transporter large permease subunit [Pseudohoeflea sp. DP4N28-3]MBW3098969.1 TRAP transporter large permease subunit [Pseudohoeflea sp. DP4N28-3]